MTLETHIRLISADETLRLRQRVLRPYLRESDCFYPEDKLITTFHTGLFHSQRLVSIATYMLESSPHFAAGFPYRLRGMATDESYRSQGLGGRLLRYGIEILKEKRCDLLWCNARIMAFPFYQSMGFQFYGPLFDIKDIGPHKVMYKILIPR